MRSNAPGTPRTASCTRAVGPSRLTDTEFTLDGHSYHARRAATLEPSPFLLLRELPGAREDMGAQSLAVTAAPDGGFLLLAESATDAEAEDLLDETCR